MLSILDAWELRFGVRRKSRGPKRLPKFDANVAHALYKPFGTVITTYDGYL